MKSLFISAILLVSAANLVHAQTQNNRDTTNQKTSGQKTTTNQKNTGTNNKSTNKNNTGSGVNTGTTGSGTTGTGTTGNTSTSTTGGTTGNTGNTTGSTQQGNAAMNNMNHAGDQLSSTGRYAAMGVQMGNLSRSDIKFTIMANSSNMMELHLSQMAAQRATNPAVKNFATMMVQHHTMASQEMKQLLSSKGALIPDSAMLPMHRMLMETAQAAQGADFDKTYMRIMVDAHEEDVDEFEDETTDAKDADIRAFATKMLPTLRQHYTRAKEVHKQP